MDFEGFRKEYKIDKERWSNSGEFIGKVRNSWDLSALLKSSELMFQGLYQARTRGWDREEYSPVLFLD